MAQPNFNLEGRVLCIDVESSDLDVYRWNAPGKVPVFFVFVGEDVHIITLDEDEKPFTSVRTKSQEKKVKIVTDDEVVLYAAEAERLLAQKTASEGAVSE